MKYTSAVGQKFYADGSVRPYPGNTIICFVDSVEHASVYNRVMWAQDQLRAMSWQHKYAFLPPSSFHMTVMDLLCDQRRDPAYWSKYLPLSTDLSETDKSLISQVQTVPAPSTLRMKYDQMSEALTSIELEPADDATRDALWRYRDAIADVTGIRFPDHDQYKFHISLAYQLIHLTPDEIAEQEGLRKWLSQILQQSDEQFVSNVPQLAFFDDMFRFVGDQERHTLATRQF